MAKKCNYRNIYGTIFFWTTKLKTTINELSLRVWKRFFKWRFVRVLSRVSPTHYIYNPHLLEIQYEQHNLCESSSECKPCLRFVKKNRSSARTPDAWYLWNDQERNGSTTCWKRTVGECWELSHFVECLLNTVPPQRQGQNHHWFEWEN